MQPILADSVPHRGRAIVFAVVLALFGLVAVAASAPTRHRARHHRGHHHRLVMHYEGCVQDRYIIVTQH